MQLGFVCTNPMEVAHYMALSGHQSSSLFFFITKRDVERVSVVTISLIL